MFEQPDKSDKDAASEHSPAQENKPPERQLSPSMELQPLRFEDAGRLVWQMDSEKRVAAWDGTYPVGAEKFRVLGHRLQQLRRSRPVNKLLVTSAIPREGKTLVATNLAFTLALSSPHTLLVDADLRLPAVQQLLTLPPTVGLAEVLEGKLEAHAAIRQLDPSGLYYLAAGHSPANPTELLQGPQTEQLLAVASKAFEWIVIDAPPVNLFADARYLAYLVDAVVLVARVGVTPRDSINQVSAALQGAYIAGVVVNCDVDTGQDRYYYSYYPER